MAKKKEKNPLPSAQDTMTLFMTVADTTWRLFVPTLGGVIIGLVADSYFSSKPILTLVGVICGTIVSLFLVLIQLKGVKKIK